MIPKYQIAWTIILICHGKTKINTIDNNSFYHNNFEFTKNGIQNFLLVHGYRTMKYWVK